MLAGIAAAIASGPVSVVLAVVAGALALGAGLVAVRVHTLTEQRHEQERRALLSERDAVLGETETRLHDAQARIDELEVALEAAPPTAEVDPAADATALTDPDSHLFSEAYFRVALDARIASARRHLRPVAIALIEVYEGLAGASSTPAPPERAAESIRQTVRDADTACRLTDGVYAIILEDTPENGAVWTVERVRRNLVSRFGSHTMWAGVACYPAHAFSTEELLDQARSALESAREWKQDRIEVAISE